MQAATGEREWQLGQISREGHIARSRGPRTVTEQQLEPHTRPGWPHCPAGGLGMVSSYSVSQSPHQQNGDDNHKGSWEDSMR